jgi:hypothetical protein
MMMTNQDIMYQKLIQTACRKDSHNITQTTKKMQQNIQIQQMKFMFKHADFFHLFQHATLSMPDICSTQN